jgi:putative addiction module killer protein
VYEIRHYLTPAEKDVYLEWRRKLRDTKIRITIDRRINRAELGNFGDHKFCQDGVYYALADGQVVLLLCGGDKRTQRADIARACEYWQEWRGRVSR